MDHISITSSMDHISVTSSTMDDMAEIDSFIYSPCFASSEASIASYKTEKTINSRKSRYNALPRHKYAGIGQNPRGSIPPVNVVPLQAEQNPILTKILIDSKASAEVHTTVLLPRPPP